MVSLPNQTALSSRPTHPAQPHPRATRFLERNLDGVLTAIVPALHQQVPLLQPPRPHAQLPVVGELEVPDRVCTGRRRVQEYNTARRQFPGNVTAGIFGFEASYPLFDAPEEAEHVPTVDFGSEAP